MLTLPDAIVPLLSPFEPSPELIKLPRAVYRMMIDALAYAA